MATNEVRVKNELIYDKATSSNSLPNRNQSNVAMKIKKEPIDSEIQTSKSHIESRSEEEVIVIGLFQLSRLLLKSSKH